MLEVLRSSLERQGDTLIDRWDLAEGRILSVQTDLEAKALQDSVVDGIWDQYYVPVKSGQNGSPM